MTPLPPTEPDLDMLREMTGAPVLDQPLVSEDAFEETVRSSRPAWKLPLPKLLLIGTALVPVFALAGFFIAGGREAEVPGVTSSAEPDAPEAAVQDTEAELQQAREEIAVLKAQMALEDQGRLQQPEASASKPAPTPPVAATAAPTPPPARVTPVQRVASTSTPAPVSYRAPAPRIQPAPVSVLPRTAGVATEAAVNPAERWQQLAQVGSYGSLETPASEIEHSLPAQPVAQAQFVTPPLTRSLTSLPGVTPQSDSVPTHSHVTSNPELMLATPAFSSTQVANLHGAASEVDPPLKAAAELPFMETALSPDPATPPALLAAAEARILQASPPTAPSIPSALVAGANSAGELATPVVLDSPGGENHFLVVLSEPLRDQQGQVAIPAGGELVVQVDQVSDTGMVQLSATQAIWNEQGLQRALRLPEGFIQIRGHGGIPLTAEQYQDVGPEIAAMDAGQFALGAIQRASELYTRPSTRVETGNGTTVITEDNPAPNLLAGMLEGGTDAVLDTMVERNQRAMAAMEQRPRIAYIEAGRPVQVFVNQSVQLPM